MTKRRSQKEIENEFFQRGFKLLEEYKNNNTPIKFQCSCGSTSTISYKSFCRGSKCMNCSGKTKHTFETVKKYIKNEGYELLEEEYDGAFKLMKMKCPEKHDCEINWNNFQQGKRCKKCSIKKVSDSIRGEKHYAWIKDRKEAKLRRVLSARCRAHLIRALKTIGTEKSNKTYKMLGYTSDDLYKHITDFYNWKEIKNTDWHLDHIFPVKAFNDYGINDIDVINGLDNLQPLEGKQNLIKNGKYNEEEFERWLESKGYKIEEIL